MDAYPPDLDPPPPAGSVGALLKKALKSHWKSLALNFSITICLWWYFGGFFGILFLLFSFGRALYNTSDRLIYYPLIPAHSRIYVQLPSTLGLDYESVTIKCADRTKLHGFLILQPGEKRSMAPTLVFLHGNAGNIGHRLPNSKVLHQLGLNVLLLEWRGYGQSEGKPSEAGFYKDAMAGIDFLLSRKDLNKKRIIVFGRSLGGAVAIDLASRTEYQDKIACLIVENSFTSIPDMAKLLIPAKPIQKLPSLFYKNKALDEYESSVFDDSQTKTVVINI
ncbi:protein ABHD13-like isoform X2 [Artemia franciscana]|uniref:protein ABHD13-like isoform X2 n=1 Tax=Artemia franciscana TaxID=6661 RepID=UPI0032DB0324